MDQENLQLQQMLHDQNQRRLDKLEAGQEHAASLLVSSQAETAKILSEIANNVKDVPEIMNRVESLEATRDRQNGAIGLIAMLWAALEAYLHWGKR